MVANIAPVLVAVSGSSRKVLEAAAHICRKSKAEMEVFCVVRPPSGFGLTEAERHQLARSAAVSQLAGLERLVKPLRESGLSVNCRVSIDRSVTEGILDRIKQYQPGLVAIEAHKHNLLSRLLLSQTDYNLIRHCPVPLLIVKNSTRIKRSAVIAALDPSQINDKPTSLDEEIITTARRLAQLLAGPLHSAHFYSPLVGYVGDAMFAPAAIPISLPEQKAYVARIRKHFRAFCARYRVPPRKMHLKMGDPAFQLPILARSLRARVVVMGAVSRGPVKRALIGSTAERVLDAMPCDILIVKPKEFRAT